MTRRRRLAIRFGLDGNALRRRTDKIAAWGAAGLLAVFLLGAPLLSVAAGRWTGHAVAAEQRAERGWHQVAAVLLETAPASIDGWGGSAATARWMAPAGHQRVGVIPVLGGTPAGTRVPIWVDATGRSWTLLRPAVARLLVAGAIAAAPVVLAVTLLSVAFIGRRLLDWRRLAAWEAAWASVGPQWTRQFWARG